MFITVIGPTWLSPRLRDQNDWVALELEAALRREIPVVPVLVGGAKMPSEADLPEKLSHLAYRHAAQVKGDPDFHRDVDRLIAGISAEG